jgi:VanZ family protein
MIDWLEENKRFALIFLILIAIEIFLISSIPGGRTPPGPINLAPAYHLIAFFLFSFFLLVYMNKNRKIGIRVLLVGLAISIVYAISDEIHQVFVPLRNPSIGDVLIDTTGILMSSLIYLYYSSRKNLDQHL